MPFQERGADGDKRQLEGMVLPRKVGKIDRVVRIALGTTSKLTGSLLAGYAAYQTASYDTVIDSNFIGAVLDKTTGGVENTVIDFKIIIDSILANLDSIKAVLLSEDATYEDGSNITRLVSQAYGNTEIDTAKATNNLFNSPYETIISSLTVAIGIKWITNTITDLLVLRDKPDLSQRLRGKFYNIFRGKNRSRYINIPKKGGDTFERV